MSRQSFIFTSACLTKKFPQSVTRTILVKDLGSTHTSGELGSTMNIAFLKTHCRSFGMAFLTLFRIATGNLDYLIKDTPSNGRLSEDYLSTSFTWSLYILRSSRGQLEWNNEGHPEGRVRLQRGVLKVRIMPIESFCCQSWYLSGPAFPEQSFM